MPITTHCPNVQCAKLLEAPDDCAGRKVRCPHCGQTLRMPDPTAADPLIGATLGSIEIEKKLGQGAMGAVYLGRNTRLDRTVAVKVLPEEIARRDPAYLKRFYREAKMAAMLNHPNAVMVYTASEDGGRHYIEMEYVQGVDLREVIRRQGRVDVRTATRIVKDVAGALGSAHRQGIVHRDVKPDNIMLTHNGQVKVTDFGLAKIGNVESSISIAGQVFGTPLYMSPEHGQGKPLDGRADIYSLGATYYHALVGGPPFTAKTALEIVMKHARDPLVWPVAADDIPPGTKGVIERMMAKRIEDRYQTCEEVVQALDGASAAGRAVAVAVPVQRAAAPTVAAPSESEGEGLRSFRSARTQRSRRGGAGVLSRVPAWLWAIAGVAAVAVAAAIVVAVAFRR